MEDDYKVVMLEDTDTEVIKLEGWRLDRMFEGDRENTMNVYETAMKYASKLSAQFRVGIRPITHDESIFMEVYRKDKA